MADEKKCSICGADYSNEGMARGHGFGHNAQPINDGRCCDLCNETEVIPQRIINVMSQSRGDRLRSNTKH